MKRKPVKATQHGIIDYVFSAIQIFGPKALSLNKKATKGYQVLGTGFLAVNALTNTPVGFTGTFSFKDHQKADAAFLTGLSLLTFSKPIRKNKKALGFHIGFLAVAMAHYALTDYNSKEKKYPY